MNKITFKLIAALLIAVFLAGGGYTSLVESLKQQLPPQEIQQTEPTPSPIPVATPSPTPAAPKVKGETTKSPPEPVDTNPIVDCKFPHSGTKKIKSSECSASVDCQLGDEWVPMLKEDCKKAQAERRPSGYGTSMVNCQLGDKWILVEKAYCDWAQKKVAETVGSLRDDIREEIAKQYGSSVEELFGTGGGQTSSQTSPIDDCRQAKTRLDEDRNRQLSEASRYYQQRLTQIGQDYSSRGLYDSGERSRAEGLAEIDYNNRVQSIESSYNSQIAALKAQGCSF